MRLLLDKGLNVLSVACFLFHLYLFWIKQLNCHIRYFHIFHLPRVLSLPLVRRQVASAFTPSHAPLHARTHNSVRRPSE